MANENVVSITVASEKVSMPAGDPPPWLPDWADESAYPDASHSSRLWAWEFLRRNLEYQADYQRFTSVPSTVIADDGVSVWSAKWSGTFSVDEDTKFFHCDPPALPGETVSEYEQRHSGKEFILENLEEHLLKKWGVSTLNDPAGEDISMGGYGDGFGLPPHFLEFESESDVPFDDPLRFEGGGGGGRRVTLRCGPDAVTDHLSHLFVRFDARYPLDRQIEEVRSLYESRRRLLEEHSFALVNPVGPQLSRLRGYLRIFDAKWHGATHREIARKMYPGLSFEEKGSVAKRIDYGLGKARDLVRRGYRDLLVWADP